MPLPPPSPFHQHIALPERTALLLSMLAPWPRRGRELLVIGCGAGHVLPPLWQSGFDLSACEASPALREQARRRAPQGVEIEAASPDWLPFADNSFDWVLLRADELPPAALPAALGEACRVAACGLALTFWNSASLPWLTWRLHGRRHAWPGHCLPFWTVWRLLAARPGRLHAASCLWRPACRWHHGTHVHAAALSRLPFGAWCVLRLDMSPRRTGTPLPLRLRPRLDTARPVMEYDSLRTTGSLRHKNSIPESQEKFFLFPETTAQGIFGIPLPPAAADKPQGACRRHRPALWWYVLKEMTATRAVSCAAPFLLRSPQ